MEERAGAGGAGHGEPHDHGHRPPGADSVEGRPSLAFIGAGHAGSALAVGLARAGWQVTAIATRSEVNRRRMADLLPGVRLFDEPHAVLDDAELVFLTVPDDQIPAVAARLHLYSGQALVHTSGALPSSVLDAARAAGTSLASFHPLVAFADLDRALRDLVGATVALEGDEGLLPLLAEMAESLGARPVRLPPDGKAPYHAAAMLAAGGLVGLLDAIAELGRAAGLDEATALSVYVPLARQTLANAESLGIDRSLTGPFVRGDVGTVRSHLDALRRLAPSALPLYVAIARREMDIASRRSAASHGTAEGPHDEPLGHLQRLLDGAD